MPFGSSFCAVPVLPAALKPDVFASFPVPSSITPTSIFLILLAVSKDTTLLIITGENSLIVSPYLSLISLTTKGRISWPPLAITDIAAANCNAVTPTSWPMGIVPIDTFDQKRGSLAIPEISPGKSIPNFEPKPKSFMYL